MRKGDIPIKELYPYLHASDALLVHKDSAEAIVVPSTANLCLGAGCPILAYNTNFFETFDKEVIKYTNLGDTLISVFKEDERVASTLQIAERYVRANSSYEIAKKFVEVFESLQTKSEQKVAA